MPALRMTTVSPMRMSLRRISSSLWSVAREIVEPCTKTGSSSATGVSTPVRPTCTVMAFEHGFRGRDPRHGFVDDGVARRARAAGNARPVGERVDLEHDAVNLVGQLPAQVAVFVVMRDDLVRVNFQNLLDAVANPPAVFAWADRIARALRAFRNVS